jgi:hypothetical protein
MTLEAARDAQDLVGTDAEVVATTPTRSSP